MGRVWWGWGGQGRREWGRRDWFDWGGAGLELREEEAEGEEACDAEEEDEGHADAGFAVDFGDEVSGGDVEGDASGDGETEADEAGDE